MPFRHAATQIGQELVCGLAVALADCVSRNQFGVSIQRHKHPGIANLVRVVNFNVALFLADEAPDFVALNPLAVQVPHLRVHERYAAFASEYQQAQNRIAVQLHSVELIKDYEREEVHAS
jgi:hypothetical protein